MPVYLTPPPRSPLARVAAAVIGAVMLVGAFMVGMVAFLVMLGLALLGVLVLAFQSWRVKRAIDRGDIPAPKSADEADSIEGEFVVVSREADRED